MVLGVDGPAVVTHLDFDHAGGLPDFPDAEVHVFATEHEAMSNPTPLERLRYPNQYFAHGPRFVVHPLDGDSWFGFDKVGLDATRVIGLALLAAGAALTLRR